jgi:hypothetical protein
MITPPLSISAIPRFTREVPTWGAPSEDEAVVGSVLDATGDPVEDGVADTSDLIR